ncbi:hypothetical protein R2Q81_03645 [Microbacterium aquimaris]|uniref:thiolase C-terminal domain-containing protein n=1 Tax=Microbacterium aquimaris TaxID=459816 RepID=UPI002AD34774|nr:hypothetical protein [Microbacterium aquimaris]MDZ8275039.1 hypothetical protein [Microbacterium aquimaris]
MTSMHGGDIAIVGAAETETVGSLPDTSMIDLHAGAAIRAMADAGVTIEDIDGVASPRPFAHEVADYLGIRPRWVDGTMVGGCSYMLLVRHAAAAIAAGAATTVLITHGESGRSQVAMPPYAFDPASMAGQFEQPFGAFAPYSTFTTPALAFLHERGMTREAMARVAVSQRRWAEPNERAFRRSPLTVEDALGAPEIAYPFTRDMCCVVTDGGGALILTSAERARDMDLSNKPVYLLGSGEATESPIVSQMDRLESSGAFRRASAEAFATAGVTHADIDHAMFYDAFAHLPLYMIEDTGFVGHGESGDFYAEGHADPGGRFPINTNGGGMSYTHTGMYGMFAIQEAVRQLRGEAAVPVPSVRTSFVHGVGLFFTASGSLVLTNEAP